MASPLRRWTPAISGFLVLVLCVAAASFLLDQRLGSTLTCETVEVVFRPARLAQGDVVVRAEVRNNSRIGATYRGLDADLLVSGEKHEYSVSGLRPGDRIESGEVIELEVVVEMSTLQLVAAGLGAVLKGKLEVVVDGSVRVAVFGVPLTLPVQVNRQVKIGVGS